MTQLPVFCLPYAGGSSTAYSTWLDVVSNLRVRPLDYPGRLMRPHDALLTSVPALAQALYDEISAELDSDYVLCGTSLGALVCYEMAELAEADGRGPRALMVCACAAPDRAMPHATITSTGDREFLSVVAETYGSAVAALLDDMDAAEIVLPALRADIQAFEEYRRWRRPPISADIIAVAGQQDSSLTFGDVAAWRDFTAGHARVLSVPGDHFFVETQSDLLLGELAALLEPHTSAWQ